MIDAAAQEQLGDNGRDADGPLERGHPVAVVGRDAPALGHIVPE